MYGQQNIKLNGDYFPIHNWPVGGAVYVVWVRNCVFILRGRNSCFIILL